MNVLAYSAKRIRHSIPPEIMRLAFSPRRYDPARRERTRDNAPGLSTDSVLMAQVIVGRVAVDVNLCSGTEERISLRGLAYERANQHQYIYRIPDEYTGGRWITQVYNVSYGHGLYSPTRGPAMNNSSVQLDMTAAVMASFSPIADTNTPYVKIIGHNTILIEDAKGRFTDAWLTCQMTHEPNFGNIQPAYYNKFSELCVLATKAEIYNQLVVDLDEGQLKAGMSLGRIREIVDSYADAELMYQDFLRDKWRVSAICNDTEKYRKILKATMRRGGF